MKLIIGSRGSQLALWQARWVAARLAELGVETELEIIKTTGDKITDVPLARVGSKGLFTKEIEDALLEGRVDLAVHSLKDLPTVLPPGLTVAAIPEREVPLDALVGKKLDELPHGARVGTSSLRRSAQLKKLRPDLHVESVRGNLDTRLRKLDEGQFDAIMLAGAGLRRLGWGDRIAELLSPDVMCPAVGQGALAIETRDDAGPALQICSKLDHPPTRAAVTAERAVLCALGGGCQVPIGAHATVDGDSLHLRSAVIDPDGTSLVADSCTGSIADAEAIGSAAAARLLENGARNILAGAYGTAQPLLGQRIVVTRARSQAGVLSSKLRALGADVIELPVIEFVPLEFATPDWSSYDWAIFTSANGVEHFFERVPAAAGPKLCAIGPGTAGALRTRGLSPSVVPDEYIAESVVAALSSEPLQGKRILLPRAALARDVIPVELTRLGAHVDVLPVYETATPHDLAENIRTIFSAVRPDWVTLTSSSTAQNLFAAAGPDLLRGVRIASIGPVTSNAARCHGLEITLEANPYTIDALTTSIVDWVQQHATSQANQAR